MEMRIAKTLAYGATLALVAALVVISIMGGARTAEADRVPPYAPEVAEKDGKYRPNIDPDKFVSPAGAAANPNKFFPLIPGTTFEYEGETEDGFECIVVEVLAPDDPQGSKKIRGVEVTVVRDRAYLNADGDADCHEDEDLVEDTFDWYAQTEKGTVWYFGEDTTEFPSGSKEGSWEAGKDGAKPGIIMKADPRVGDSYRQEFYKGEAEDMAEVLSLREEASVPYDDSLDKVLMTKEWTPLEPEVLEHKYYAEGVGNIGELAVRGGQGRIELVNVTTP
jgi:hypothetical protein